MKLTLAQLNPIIGDLAGNFSKLEAAVIQAAKEDSDLVIFPELFLTGYPPKDMLERKWFLDKVDETIERVCVLAKEHPAIGILLGAPTPSKDKTGTGLYNSALLIHQGKTTFTQNKTLLPSYDVFDETRYFDPATEANIIKFKGEFLGISLCEDAWNDPLLFPELRKYAKDPIEELAAKKATIMINISASPFNIGKEDIRLQFIKNHARKYSIPFVYVNQIGGNDELIFDGHSFIVDEQGDVAYAAPSFTENLKTIDTAQLSKTKMPQKDKLETVHQALVLGIKDYLTKCGFKKAVLGLSGGIDSALVCYLAAEALGKENVLGISMPSHYSSAGSVDDSKALAENLGIDFKVISIKDIFDNYLKTLQEPFAGQEPDCTEENIQARIRGNILMAFSNKFGYLTLTTGNKSELAVGYCTLYGDMSGGLSVISDVPKTLVYELANYINRDKEIIPHATIEKAPSAELRPDQKDQDTLPPYPVLDKILYYYIEEKHSTAEIKKMGLDPETVDWVTKTVDRNEYKRKQAAPGLKVTSKAFGIGRRMPIAAKY
jgi:NAD+ synthase (glutamine-hydrolysing)